MKLVNFDISLLENSESELFTFVNPFSYYLLESSLEPSDLKVFTILVDGISLVKAHNLLHNQKLTRYSFDFTSLAPLVFKYCVDKELSVAIVGGTEEEVKNAVEEIKNRFPTLNVVFSSNGFIDITDGPFFEKLRKANPDFILSGMGTPKQERFILECKKRGISFKFAFTCGGFISQIASNPEYFHPFFDRLNLRWLQRFCRHSYVRKRVLWDYPNFFIKYFVSYFKAKR